uniref:Uncharacterized protein n=1 Tax=Anguilla anguilla TaxID=7936 RepID=A0A0E9WWI9_ANGAN
MSFSLNGLLKKKCFLIWSGARAVHADAFTVSFIKRSALGSNRTFIVSGSLKANQIGFGVKQL